MEEELLREVRGNGYNQCYNDVLLILVTRLASHPKEHGALNAILDEMMMQKEIRKVTGYSHPEEIVKG